MDNYTDYRESKVWPYVVAARKKWINGPISVQFGLTHVCVNQCVMCQHWARPNKPGVVSFVDADRAVTILKVLQSEQFKCESVCFSGGEPMAHPRFKEIFAAASKMARGVITGGVGCAFNEDIIYLRDAAWVRVSLDAVDAETYGRSRGPGYQQAMDNAHRLINERVPVGFGITVHTKNCHGVPQVLEQILNWLAAAVSPKIESVRLWLVRDEPKLALTVDHLRQLWLGVEGPLMELERCHIPTNASEVQFRCLNPAAPDDLPEDAPTLRCAVPLVHIYIDASLRVFPCCVHAGDIELQPRAPHVWDLSRQTVADVIADIWDKEAALHDYSEANPEVCRDCTLRLYTINKSFAVYDRMRGPNRVLGLEFL